MDICIKSACAQDAPRLTEIAFAAKRHWLYPEEWMDVWKDELTITPEYINRHMVFTASYNDRIVGFYSVVKNTERHHIGLILIDKGYWLEHIFIDPAFIGRGIGTRLIGHLRTECRFRNIDKVLAFVDPNAEGFYKKIGARFKRMSMSSIPGRNVPVYVLEL
ncbi:MAG: GNAT family N-acetyltransferase [Spirochaetales bacterium]|nr:GNAT family N-acetyltransferase [Spirochaetales bacterium]